LTGFFRYRIFEVEGNLNQEPMRYRGMLLKEHFGDEAVLKALELAKTTGWKVKDAHRELKVRWTAIAFEAESPEKEVVQVFNKFLKKSDWFLRLVDDERTIVAFFGKVFAYPNGDTQGRAEAVEYGRSINVSELLLDTYL
jgi:hypothetical protein